MSSSPPGIPPGITYGVSRGALPLITHQVYVRHARDGAPALNGERTGYILDPRLRCDSIVARPGPRVASATISYVPAFGDPQSVEDILAIYDADDQVMVVAQPIVDELQPQMLRNPEDENDVAGIVLFEGVLLRPTTRFQADSQSDAEGVAWNAWALPAAIDNRDAVGHLIHGRLVPAPGTFAPGVEAEEPRALAIESHAFPAVFNFRSRPNRHATVRVTSGDQSSDPVATLTAPLWTHDHDATGRYWTVRDALQLTLLWALYGVNTPVFPYDVTAWPRTLGVHRNTLAGIWNLVDDNADGELDGPRYENLPERWEGLDAVLPEVSIHGKHVLNALQEICLAGGFEFYIRHRGWHTAPHSLDNELSPDDRPYVLHIQKRGTGTQVTVDLAKRGTTFLDAESATLDNSMARAQLLRDNENIENSLIGQGQALIESRFDLLPLWNPDDAADFELSTDQQATPENEDLEGDGYFARHTSKGAQFGQYGHVFRRWGLACLPGFVGHTTPAIYVQDEDGFDFVEYLQLNASGSGIFDERLALGVETPIVWMRRRRTCLPLQSAEAKLLGRQLMLEVSEDGGETWQLCPVQFKTLTDDFGISLNLDNLATVNQASLTGGESPEPETSWLGLMLAGELLFRITCAVECDHGGRCIAPWRQSSASRYETGGIIPLNIEEVWRDTQRHYWPLEDRQVSHVKLAAGQPLADGDFSSPVRDMTQAYQAAHEASLITGSIVCPITELERYQVGQVVTQIRGRNLSLASTGGTGLGLIPARYPAIASIEYSLGDRFQAVTLTLTDSTLTPTGGA